VPPLSGLEVDITTTAFTQRRTSLSVHASDRAAKTGEAFSALLD
jgi:hypothetical protein